MKRNVVVSFSFIVVLSIVIWSCVDVNNTNLTTQDYRSLVRFTHVASGSQAAGAVTVDGATVGTIAYLQSTSYINLPAGGRAVSFAGSPGNALTFNTDQQGTVFIFTSGSTTDFIFTGEGDMTKNMGQPSSALVKFVHVAKDFAPNLSFRDNSLTGSALAGSVAFKTDNAYTVVSPGSHQVFVVSNGGYAANMGGGQEPSVTTNDTGSGTFAFNVTGDTLPFNISVTTDNRVGVRGAIYIAAHFHRGGPGVSGPVVFPIALDSQVVSFPTDSLKGANEVPPDTTAARGAGSFTLTARSGGTTFELSDSITVDTATSDPFVAAHFHTGAAGTSGPVVRTIAGPVSDTTLTGTWSSSDAVQPLTSALVDSLLKGRIYVNFHTTMHPGGAIRAQVVPDTATTNVYIGAWGGIPDSTRDSIMSGRYYVNFHTAANPGGQIRGQIVVDPSKGHYGVASLPTTDTTFAAGRVYSVVATGSGLNIQLVKLSNRQVGVPKPAAKVDKNLQKPKSLMKISE